jgi:predicted GNAT family acetyltransferase
MKKQDEQNRQHSERAIIYCTECGAELENFCFSGSANDLAAIKKTLAHCRKEGKFVGDFCSKLFIAEAQELDDILREVEELRSRRGR